MPEFTSERQVTPSNIPNREVPEQSPCSAIVPVPVDVMAPQTTSEIPHPPHIIAGGLSREEAERFRQLEETCQRALDASVGQFLILARGLHEIQVRKLYREVSTTFANYVRDRWDLGKSRLYQLIDVHKTSLVYRELTGSDLPAGLTERSLRSLHGLSKEARGMILAEAGAGVGVGANLTPASIERASYNYRRRVVPRGRGVATRQGRDTPASPMLGDSGSAGGTGFRAMTGTMSEGEGGPLGQPAILPAIGVDFHPERSTEFDGSIASIIPRPADSTVNQDSETTIIDSSDFFVLAPPCPRWPDGLSRAFRAMGLQEFEASVNEFIRLSGQDWTAGLSDMAIFKGTELILIYRAASRAWQSSGPDPQAR